MNSIEAIITSSSNKMRKTVANSLRASNDLADNNELDNEDYIFKSHR